MSIRHAILKLPVVSGFAMIAACTGHTAAPRSASSHDTVLSLSNSEFSASVPDIAVDPKNPERVAIFWRYISMHDANQEVQRHLECRLSLSTDGGRTFSEQLIDWNSANTPVCNSPSVDIGPDGEIMIAATLAGVLPQGAPEGSHPYGRVGMRISRDWGKTWSETQGPIASDMDDRFELNPAVPHEATKVPWDGGRGIIDPVTRHITISGGFPAHPGEDLHSQRFFVVSRDGGHSWGPIRAWGAPGWSQRWDGTMISAHGKLAVAYLAGEAGLADANCLCIVFAKSADDGKTFERHFVAEIDDFDRLVHYPPIAANPLQDGSYALAHVAKDRGSPVVRMSVDGGATWQEAVTPPAPAGVVRASRPAIAYSNDGSIVLLWRGYMADGSYRMFMAAARDDGRFGKAFMVSSEVAREPEIYLKDYSVRGDFISSLAAGGGHAQGVWTDWRSGRVGQIVHARVEIDRLLPKRP